MKYSELFKNRVDVTKVDGLHPNDLGFNMFTLNFLKVMKGEWIDVK